MCESSPLKKPRKQNKCSTNQRTKFGVLNEHFYSLLMVETESKISKSISERLQ